MRNFIVAAAITFGALITGPVIASPVATSAPIAAPMGVDPVQYYRGDRDWRPSRRHWDRPGRGYGRRFHGPPPHARAYGRRSFDRGYYRY